ncbi:MAG TPA: hypothetical protein VGA70_05195 [Longimicrobiales bacterium]|jgi:hypothetical protein
MKRAGWVLAFLGALALGACGDDRPEGPGSFTGEVRSSLPSVGAVIVEITGTGIEAVEGAGSTLAFGDGAAQGAEGGVQTRRYILVNEASGTLAFTVRVAELAEGHPAVVVLAAVDADNQPITSLVSFSVDLSR